MILSMQLDLCPQLLMAQLEGETGASLPGDRWEGKGAWWV